MALVNSNASKSAAKGAGVTVRVYASDHREMKIASAHRDEEIQSLISKSWEMFKAAEGKNLHKRQASEDVA